MQFSTVNLFPAPLHLDRIEVLRGPQGTLFGAGSEGGTIRVLTPEPRLQDYTACCRSEYASTDGDAPSDELGAAINGHISQGHAGFSAEHRLPARRWLGQSRRDPSNGASWSLFRTGRKPMCRVGRSPICRLQASPSPRRPITERPLRPRPGLSSLQATIGRPRAGPSHYRLSAYSMNSVRASPYAWVDYRESTAQRSATQVQDSANVVYDPNTPLQPTTRLLAVWRRPTGRRH